MRDRLFDTAETARTSAGHCRRATVKLDEFTRRWPASVADRLPGNLTVAEEKLTAADTAFDAATSACIEAEGDVTGAQSKLNDAIVAAADAGADTHVVPARIRSAELWGDEKLIDSLVDSAVWGVGRLTWELLRAERLPPPLVIRRVGPGSELLVVENIDPFWLCVGLLVEGTTTIGRVAWGAGKAFVATAPSIAEEADIPTRIWYWGDGDPEGVRMPAAAAPIVAAAGLPPLEPAVRLWRAYARVEVRGQGNYSWRTVPSGWLGSGGWAALGAARRLSGRVPQESIGRSVLEAIFE
ncbi:MAG: hypothetical protein E6G66_02955 [Actinobacteria bacterium]|nr:MAG: hypothetical protein E6G66_02955 [Actinomycetota bacterium]